MDAVVAAAIDTCMLLNAEYFNTMVSHCFCCQKCWICSAVCGQEELKQLQAFSTLDTCGGHPATSVSVNAVETAETDIWLENLFLADVLVSASAVSSPQPKW